MGSTGKRYPVRRSRSPPNIGIYRQSCDSGGRLVGADTRAVRSIAACAATSSRDPRAETYPFTQQMLAAAQFQDRCVVLAAGINQVDAYAYDLGGRLKRNSALLRSHRRLSGNIPDKVLAVWSAGSGVLLDMRYTGGNAPESIRSYGLR